MPAEQHGGFVRSGVEQSFSKASRCFHDGRFGPKAEDTERRCMTVLCMTDKDDQEAIVFGARTLFASAVTRLQGLTRESLGKQNLLLKERGCKTRNNLCRR